MNFSNVNIVLIVDTGMVYPTYNNSLKEKEIKECALTYEYICDDVKCNFDQSLNAIMESSELKSRGLRDITVVIVEALSKNQQLFTVKEAQGFVLQSTGKSQVFLKNKTGVEFPERRCGFIDLTETRRRLIHQHELQKLNFWTPGQVGTGFTIGAAASIILMKVLKKI
jgi:hypothetical protein